MGDAPETWVDEKNLVEASFIAQRGEMAKRVHSRTLIPSPGP
jgi:hypothetical protein